MSWLIQKHWLIYVHGRQKNGGALRRLAVKRRSLRNETRKRYCRLPKCC
nr:MAG TPA: hypothetical protein [Caudoviricetes sp.]